MRLIKFTTVSLSVAVAVMCNADDETKPLFYYRQYMNVRYTRIACNK